MTTTLSSTLRLAVAFTTILPLKRFWKFHSLDALYATPIKAMSTVTGKKVLLNPLIETHVITDVATIVF
jgi:hypothetical protein